MKAPWRLLPNFYRINRDTVWTGGLRLGRVASFKSAFRLVWWMGQDDS